MSGQNQYPTHFSMPFEAKWLQNKPLKRSFSNHHVQQRIFTPNSQVIDVNDCNDDINVL